ncbi:MAG: hypothetical protein IEMM0001_2132 [bacterium]|nr:MAG: hypothetical protein IEMM0001_2132 [bacterium]
MFTLMTPNKLMEPQEVDHYENIEFFIDQTILKLL